MSLAVILTKRYHPIQANHTTVPRGSQCRNDAPISVGAAVSVLQRNLKICLHVTPDQTAEEKIKEKHIKSARLCASV